VINQNSGSYSLYGGNLKIAIGSDHVGYQYKDEIINHLNKNGYQCQDFGVFNEDRTAYPIYAKVVCKAVIAGGFDRGILICGTGVGMSIAANKFHGIRAVVCSEPYSAMLSMQHNDTNILSFGARVIGIELAKMIIDAWLSTKFEGGRHQERVDMITDFESNQ
jgi:ribose 5-phosphate isomerase B